MKRAADGGVAVRGKWAKTAGPETADADRKPMVTPSLHASLSTLSTVFLRGGKHPWLGGISKTPTFADISAVCELDQLRMLPAAQHEAIASRHPAVFAWARRVGEHFEPHYGEVTAMLRKAVAARRERAKM